MNDTIEYKKFIIEYQRENQLKSYHIFVAKVFVAKADAVNFWVATSVGGLETDPFLKILPVEIKTLNDAVEHVYSVLDKENTGFKRIVT